MQKRRDQNRSAWALLLSFFLHAAFALWMVFGDHARESGPVVSQAIQVEIIQVEAPKPPEPEQAAAPARAPTPEQKSKKKTSAPIEAVVIPQPAAGEPGAPAKTDQAPVADAPRTVTLQPSLGVVLPGLGSGERELSKGKTIVNGPGEEPDAVALREYTEDTIKRRLDEDLLNGAAAARARSGLMDPYFTRLGSKLNDGLGKAGVELRERKVGEILRDEVFGTWQETASRYGKDGNPLNSPEEERRVVESGLGRQAGVGAVNGLSGGDVNGQREMAKALQQFGAMEAVVASAQRARLRTVIELRQGRDGALAEAVFLERSGDEKFDEFVLHEARKVVREQGEIDPGDETPFKEGWRSVWAFTWEPPKVKAKLLRVLRGQPSQPFLLPRP
jgi:hypothetical protein